MNQFRFCVQALFCIFYFATLVDSLACDCFCVNSFFYYYNHSDRIFKGEVLRLIRDKDQENEVEILAMQYYKGDARADTLRYPVHQGSGSCGWPLSVGEIWILFEQDGGVSKCEPNFRVFPTTPDPLFIDYFPLLDVPGSLNSVLKNRSLIVHEVDTARNFTARGTICDALAEGEWTYTYDSSIYSFSSEVVQYHRGAALRVRTYKGTRLLQETTYSPKERRIIRYFQNGTIREKEFMNGSVTTRVRYFKNGSTMDSSVYDQKVVLFSVQYYRNEVTKRSFFYNDREELMEILLFDPESKRTTGHPDDENDGSTSTFRIVPE